MRRFVMLISASALILFAGCKAEQQKKEITKEENKTLLSQEQPTFQDKDLKTVVARINGRPIYKEEVGEEPLERVIDEEILYEIGLKQGLDKNKKLEEKVERYKKRLIINAVRAQILDNIGKKEPKVSDEEIENYYKENENRYRYLSLKAIITNDRKVAEEIHKRALKGEDFEKIVSDYSNNSGKEVTLRELSFTRRYNDIFKGKEIGSVSNIIQEGNRFIILKVTDVRQIELQRVKPAIRTTIAAQKKGEALHDYIEKLKKENNIKVEIFGN
jgi:hypothetical protein